MGNFNKDKGVEAVVGDWIDKHYWTQLSGLHFRRIKYENGVEEQQLQKAGVDFVATAKATGRELLVDEKAKTYGLISKEPGNISFELSSGNSGRIGWFINPAVRTTHIAFMFLSCDPGIERPCEITTDNIQTVNVVIIDKNRFRGWLADEYGITTEALVEKATEERPRWTWKPKTPGLNDAFIFQSLKFREKPINLCLWLNDIIRQPFSHVVQVTRTGHRLLDDDERMALYAKKEN